MTKKELELRVLILESEKECLQETIAKMAKNTNYQPLYIQPSYPDIKPTPYYESPFRWGTTPGIGRFDSSQYGSVTSLST
jgi:hypothetical protein